MSHFVFNLEIVEQASPSFRLRPVSEPVEMPVRTTRRFDCLYSYETGTVVAQEIANSPFEFFIGRVPNDTCYDQNIRDAAMAEITSRLSAQRAEANNSVESSYRRAWGEYQAMTRTQRTPMSFRVPQAQAEPAQAEPAQAEPTQWGCDYVRSVPAMTFEAVYEQEYNSPLPREAIDRATRAVQENQERQIAGELSSRPDPYAINYSERDVAQSQRFASLYGATPAPREQTMARSTRRTSRNSRPKRRHYLTLVPYINFTKCAKCFNDRDLKLMRVTALRVLKFMANPRSDTPRGVTLWVGYEQALVRYGYAIAKEIRRRGFADTSYEVFKAKLTPGLCNKPEWIKWSALRKSHQSYMMMREERRHAAKHLIKWATHQMYRGQRMLLVDVCNHLGIDQRRTWQHHTLQNIQHSFMSSGSTVLPVFRSDYAAVEGWNLTPEENFRYPGN